MGLLIPVITKLQEPILNTHRRERLRAFWSVPPTLSHFFFFLVWKRKGVLAWSCPPLLLARCALGFSWSLSPACEYHSQNGERCWLPGEARRGTPVCPGAETPLAKHSLLGERLLLTKERRREQTLKRPKLLLLLCLPFYLHFFGGYPLQLSSLFLSLSFCESCP